MRPFLLHKHRPIEEVGADGYQEFAAGAIPVKQVMTSIDGPPLVLVEHERGFQVPFDEHLESVGQGASPGKGVDYKATWAGMTGGPAGPPLIRLELQIDGLQGRARLLFRGGLLPALWFLANGADLALLIGTWPDPGDISLAPMWLLGPTPLPGKLRRILRDLEVWAPAALLSPRGRLRTRRRGARRRPAPAM